MLKNKIRFFSLLLAFIIVSCADDLPKDPLLVPPNFAVLPTENENKGLDEDDSADIGSPSSDKDIEELKDLLLD